MKSRGVPADKKCGEIPPQPAATRRKANEPEAAANEAEPHNAQPIEPYPQVEVKHEPPVEFVLILPPPNHKTEEEDVGSNTKWVESVKLKKFDARWPSESKPFQTFLTCPPCQLIMNKDV